MNSAIKVGIVGGFQMGKSTLVNCLLDDKVARTGNGISTTKVCTRYTWGEYQSVKYYSGDKIIHSCRLTDYLNEKVISEDTTDVVVTLWKPCLQNVDIIDTPGFNANSKDSKVAIESLNNLDFVIVLLNNKGLSEPEKAVFKEIARKRLPFIVVVNCMDNEGNSWNPFAEINKLNINSISNEINNIGYKPIAINGHLIWSFNLMWFWYSSEHILQDDEEKIRKITSKIEKYLNDFEDLELTEYESIVELSNLIPFRDIFSNVRWGFPLNYIRWSSIINNTFCEWENNIKQLAIKI